MPEVTVSFYPNPAVDNVTINLDNIEGKSTLSLYSADGKQILQRQVFKGFNTLSLAGLPCGIYSYTITQNNQTLYWGTIAHN
jgi:hypothetical protein